MDQYQGARVKWPYVTHLVDRTRATQLLPPVEEVLPGSLVLARVVSIGKHRELETESGRRMAIFEGDVFVGALGNRYATDQFEGVARCSGTLGHILGMGGVCGEVVSMNNRMIEPTVIEWLGRLADSDGRPLHLSRFHLPRPGTRSAPRPTTLLSLGASMNAGKTTTAAQVIRSLTRSGHRVAAAKVTGTACRKDPNLLYDAGAVNVLDFTHAGWPSTAGCSREELLGIVAHLRSALLSSDPEFVVIEVADGIVQRETAMMLEDPAFRDSIDGVTFAGPDALSCDAGVRRLQALGFDVLATAGPVANGVLGVREAESACGIPCLDGVSLLAGALVPALRTLAASRTRGGSGRGGSRRQQPETRAAGGTDRPSARFGGGNPVAAGGAGA